MVGRVVSCQSAFNPEVDDIIHLDQGENVVSRNVLRGKGLRIETVEPRRCPAVQDVAVLKDPVGVFVAKGFEPFIGFVDRIECKQAAVGPQKQVVFLDENALDGQRTFGVRAGNEVVSVETVQAVTASEPGRTIGLPGDGAEGKQFRLAAEIVENGGVCWADILPAPKSRRSMKGRILFILFQNLS